MRTTANKSAVVRSNSRSASPWAALATRVNRSEPPKRPLYQGLARRLKVRPADEVTDQLYQALMQRVDPAQYTPRRIEHVATEELYEDGQSYTVLRSPGGQYLRLNPTEAEIWRAMDGTKSVAALATMGFLRFGQLLPVAGLVQELGQQGFLTDAPTSLYRSLRERLESRRVESLGQRILQTLRGHEFAVNGLDGFTTQLYRLGGRFLFTRWFLALHGLIALIGLICFGVLLGSGYNLLDAEHMVGSLLALWAALLISFMLHELAHALAVKHFGRRVLRGGVMIYYGMPAAFVDTSDIWMAGRKARILVSLAGPLCDLLIGSLGAIAAILLPEGWLGAAAFRLATACYLAALFNFNPLLELDGYYMLTDGLRLPNLRRRALSFISGPFWQKLRVRADLSREERIFALYGLLATAYTTVAVILAAIFWQEQLIGVLSDLWAGGIGGRILALLIGLAVLVPVGLGILAAAWGLFRAAAAWLARRGYGRSPLVVAAALSLLAVALAGLPLRYGFTVETALIAPLLWLVALAAQLALHRDYAGAAIQRALDSFLVVTLIELTALGGLLLFSEQGPFWSALENVGFTLLLFAGFVALLDIDLHRSRPAELAVSAVLLGVAFLAGGVAIKVIELAHPEWSAFGTILAATPVYAGIVALALLLPLLISLRDSRLRWSWMLLGLGIGWQIVSYMLELLPAWRNSPPAVAILVLASGLWCAAWSSHYVALRQVHTRTLHWPLEPALGESERLRRAFRHTYAGLYRTMREYAGSRRARLLDDRMDVLAATANWDITLERDEARISSSLIDLPLDVQGVRYAEVLRYTVNEITILAGATFARRAILAAYDALPWPEREAADRHTFVHTPWAAILSQTFGDDHAARLHLLRQVELFASCDDKELAALAAAMEARQVPAGQQILAAGIRAPGVWIIEAGEIVVRNGETTLRELHRGDYFGNLGDDKPSEAGFRASVETELLFLPTNELQRMLQSSAPHTAEGIALVGIVGQLERIPMLRNLPRATLRSLARNARQITVRPREVIIREGRPGGQFYVVEQGRAAVVRRNPESGRHEAVAQIGPAEFFGELELLRHTPPVASIVAISEMQLIALPHSAIAAVLAGTATLARGLEQVGSGRIIELQQATPPQT